MQVPLAIAHNSNRSALLTLRYTIGMNRSHELLLMLLILHYRLSFLSSRSWFRPNRFNCRRTPCLLRFVSLCSLPGSHAQGILFIIIILILECLEILLLLSLGGEGLLVGRASLAETTWSNFGCVV